MKQIVIFTILNFATFCFGAGFRKCSIYDSKCQKDFFQEVGRTFAYTGIPAVGIPVIDPFRVTNVTLSILGLLNLTLVEGTTEGIGKCIVTKYETNVESRYKVSHVICDKIIIKGSYLLTPAKIDGPTCAWCNVQGKGNGSITLEKWFFNIKYPFQIIRHSDGNIYLHPGFEKAMYEAGLEKVSVEATGIKMGDKDISETIISFINNNWKLLMNSDVGKFINDTAVKYYYQLYGAFFERIPASRYTSDADDLSALVVNKTKEDF